MGPAEFKFGNTLRDTAAGRPATLDR